MRKVRSRSSSGLKPLSARLARCLVMENTVFYLHSDGVALSVIWGLDMSVFYVEYR